MINIVINLFLYFNNMSEQQPKESALAMKVRDSYITRSIMDDFNKFSTTVKLAVLQKVPGRWIKSRDIAGKKVFYLDYMKAQRCLNFVFNFNVNMEIVDKKIIEYTQKTSKGSSTVYEAMVHTRFTCGDQKIIRDIISTHKSFENVAMSHNDCFKGAVSKAWTLLAYSFGIASNVRETEDVETYEEKEEIRFPNKVPVEKTFHPNY